MDIRGISDIFNHIRAMATRIAKLEEALRFYADPENYDMMVDEGTGLAVSSIEIDEGAAARKALEE